MRAQSMLSFGTKSSKNTSAAGPAGTKAAPQTAENLASIAAINHHVAQDVHAGVKRKASDQTLDSAANHNDKPATHLSDKQRKQTAGYNSKNEDIDMAPADKPRNTKLTKADTFDEVRAFH